MISANSANPANPASLLTRVRMGAVVGGVAAALVLTGCGSSDDGDDGAKGGSGEGDSGSSAAATPSESSGTGGGSGAEGGSLEGSWVATTGGKTVALVITDGKAGLFDSGGTTCSGTGGKEMGMQMIHLKCTDGSDDRADGMVDSVTATTMKVKWEGFGNETYTKSEDGKLPEGLPTADLPSS